MFFSKTLLARKEPLGTVWCAAHLQHLLKKSHYTSTDISSTVERIMFPDVPIALRMQGHLLLGVVRIFSKKVDYLLQDCNVVRVGICKAFTSVQVDLPEDTTQAPFYSVTLPDKFELDALDIDIDYDEGLRDNHHKNKEDITLPDQFGGSPYITININEDISMEETVSPQGSGQVDKSIHNQAEDPVTGPSNQIEGEQNPTPERRVDNNSPDVNFQIRDVYVPIPDTIEPDQAIEKEIMESDLNWNMVENKSNPVSQEREIVNDIDANNFAVGVDGPSTTPDEAPHQGTVGFTMQQSASPVVVQPAVRKRKRRLFDLQTVLTNEFMRAGLDDTRNIRRTRRSRSSSVLGVWKSSKRLAKERVFLEPLITGISEDLNSLYPKDFIASKPHLAKESVPESNNSSSGPHSNDCDMETEVIRDNINPTNESPLSFPLNEPANSPRTGDFTRQFGNDVSPTQEQQFVSTAGTSAGIGSTTAGASAGIIGSEMSDHMDGLEPSKLSDIAESEEFACEDELGFLLKENNTTPSVAHSGGDQGIRTLSRTTIKVAEYLREKSSCTPISGHSSGDLVLDKLVEGKSRKICARMFFETLVLKNSGLVDVHQEEPYADISLKLTPQIFKCQI